MEPNNFPRMHVSLYVSDIDKTVKFYNTFFGRAADKTKTGYAKYILDRPSLIISFVQNADRVKSKFGHLGFQMETADELIKRKHLVKETGLAIIEETGTNCCYALQDKFWVSDPDGHQWEVYYFHSDVEFNDPHYSDQDANACCMPPTADSHTATEPKKKVSLSALTEKSESCAPGSGCC